MSSTISVALDVLTSMSVRNSLRLAAYSQAKLTKLSRDYDQYSGEEFSTYEEIGDASSKKDLQIIDSHINNFLISTWIDTLDLKFMVPAGFKYTHDGVYDETVSPMLMDIKGEDGMELFQKIMENEIIPYLKTKYPDNVYIQDLVLGMKNGAPYYRLPIDMMHIDASERDQVIYEGYLNAFNELSTEAYTNGGVNHNVADLFYLYNLVVNKDKFGATSLTRIFEDLVSGKRREDFLVTQFSE